MTCGKLDEFHCTYERWRKLDGWQSMPCWDWLFVITKMLHRVACPSYWVWLLDGAWMSCMLCMLVFSLCYAVKHVTHVV